MNTATIRRNSGRGTRGGISGSAAKRPSKRKGLMARLAEKLPFDENQLHKMTTWVLGLVLIGMLWLAAVFLGVPAMIWSEVSDLAKHAGLQVAKVEVHGTEHMDELPVYNQAIKQVDHSMIDLDLVGLRAEIHEAGLGRGRARLAPPARIRWSSTSSSAGRSRSGSVKAS